MDFIFSTLILKYYVYKGNSIITVDVIRSKQLGFEWVYLHYTYNVCRQVSTN